MVDLNITLWIQLANFLVTLVVLNYLLISPIRKAREAAAIYRKDGKVMGELERARIFDAASKDAQSEVRTTQAAVRADAGVTRRALQAKMHEFTEAAMAKLLA